MGKSIFLGCVLAVCAIAGRMAAEEQAASPPVATVTDYAEFDNSDIWPTPDPECTLPCRGALSHQGVTLWPYSETRMGATLYTDETGRLFNLSLDQLPPAADPNDFHVNPLHTPPGLNLAAQSRLLHLLVAPTCASYSDSMPTISYGLEMRPGFFYDTGAFESEKTDFRPGKIALDGSTDAHRRGRFYFYELPDNLQSLPARMQFNAAFAEFLNADFAQAYVDMMHIGDNTLRGRSAFIRAYAGDDGLLLGKAETAFGDLGSSPMLVATGALPIGAVGIVDEATDAFTSVAQVRYTRHWNNDRLETTVSVEENRSLGDVDYAGEIEHFWPSVVGRLRVTGDNGFNSFQLAALVRPIWFNDDTFNDHAVTGWGVSAIGRLCNEARTDALYFGVTGGQGIGGYIYGDIRAAYVPTPTSIRTLDNFGAYVAYQRAWAQFDVTRNLSSNLAYGYTSSDTTSSTDNRRLHQAWCNLLWNHSDNSAFGIEYNYGRREVGDATSGDNHRIMFVAQFSTDTARKQSSEQSYARRQQSTNRPIQWRRL
jgi:hypothetical protein